MPIVSPSTADPEFMRAAHDEVRTGYDEGGPPNPARLILPPR